MLPLKKHRSETFCYIKLESFDHKPLKQQAL